MQKKTFTLNDITAAARATTQTRPRPGPAFWREVICAYLLTARGTEARKTAAESRGKAVDAYTCELLLRLEGVSYPQMSEADMRATLVELLIRGAGPDPEPGCARWAEVFGLTSEAP